MLSFKRSNAAAILKKGNVDYLIKKNGSVVVEEDKVNKKHASNSFVAKKDDYDDRLKQLDDNLSRIKNILNRNKSLHSKI